jgi:hypothetical protein
MSAPAPAIAPRSSIRHRLAAFGLSIECEWGLPGALPVAIAVGGAARTTTIRLQSEDRLGSAWLKPAQTIYEPEYPDGARHFRVERGSDAYRVRFAGFGRYLVALDGRLIECERTAVPRRVQERFLFAQVLPLAGVLQGLELFHASAVSVGDAVIAFVGPSGIGKTSLASRLVLRGASFVTDDVLAVERSGNAVVAHPGPPFLALPNADRDLLDSRRGALGTVVGSSDKLHVSPPRVRGAMPLRVVYHLERGRALRIAKLGPDGAHRILGSAFAPYLTLPERLRRHLEIAQLVSSSVCQFRLVVPRKTCFANVLDAVETHHCELAL